MRWLKATLSVFSVILTVVFAALGMVQFRGYFALGSEWVAFGITLVVVVSYALAVLEKEGDNED